jgi:hypothetical protein
MNSFKTVCSLPSQTSNEKIDVFTRKKRTFLRVKKNFSFREKRLRQRLLLTTRLFMQKNSFFLTRKNVRFIRVKTSFLCCLSDWVSNFCYVSFIDDLGMYV